MMKFCKMQQRTFRFFISYRSCGRSCNDYHIQTTIEYTFMQSVTFSDQSGNSMSYDTITDFFTYTDSYSVLIKAIFLHIHDKVLVGIRSAILVHKTELLIIF